MKEIGRTELQTGNWIQFRVTQDQLEHLSERRKNVYNQFYLVVSRSDRYLDKCRCVLMDMAGKTHDYCAKTFMFDYGESLIGRVLLIDPEELASMYKSEEIQAVYNAAEENRASFERFSSSF